MAEWLWRQVSADENDVQQNMHVGVLGGMVGCLIY
jgi:hypothetical protein